MFFSVGNSFFCHVVGIAMGSDPALFMANLFIIMKTSNFYLLGKVSQLTLQNFVMFSVLSMIFASLMITLSLRRSSRIFILKN